MGLGIELTVNEEGEVKNKEWYLEKCPKCLTPRGRDQKHCIGCGGEYVPEPL